MSNRTFRVDRLLGRRVFASNNRAIGRLEEFRAEQQGAGWTVTSYVIGPAGLWERLGIRVAWLVGATTTRGYIARWDQIDLSNPDVPRLRCSVEELERLGTIDRDRH
jgi:hypothetical protein